MKLKSLQKNILLQSFILIPFIIIACTGAAKDFYDKSDVFGKLSAPIITPADGTTFNPSLTVNITASTAGTVICYSNDASVPSCNAAKDGCDNGTIFTTPLNITATATITAIACKNEMAESDPSTSVFTYDPNPPILTGSSPDNDETNIDPTSGTIILSFNENMDTGQTEPAFTTRICGGNTDSGFGTCFTGVYWSDAPNNGTVFTWLDKKTLQIKISWIFFPENTKITYILSKDDLKDAAGNAMSADITRTFTTTGRINPYEIADTGQTSCYYCANYDGSDEDCDDAGEAWTEDDNCDSQTYSIGSFDKPYGQDAHYNNKPNARSFTGPTQHGTYTNDYTTTDNVTGLVWKSCNEGLSGPDCTTGTVSSMDWYNALNQCAALNAANSGIGYAGRTDWRLPTANEVTFLPNHNVDAPAMDVIYFPNPSTSSIWSATTSARTDSQVRYSWYFQYNAGRIWNNYKYNTYYVRCVSGGKSGQTYTVNEQTLADNASGLVWQKCSMGLDQASNTNCSSGTLTAANSWQAALEYCENLSLDGSDQWRLPSFNELESIVNRSGYPLYINSTAFPNTKNYDYWTSTSGVWTTGFKDAWVISFVNANDSITSKSDSDKFVRCVRDP